MKSSPFFGSGMTCDRVLFVNNDLRSGLVCPFTMQSLLQDSSDCSNILWLHRIFQRVAKIAYIAHCTLHNIIINGVVKSLDRSRHVLGIWICGCSLFYRRELWASKYAVMDVLLGASAQYSIYGRQNSTFTVTKPTIDRNGKNEGCFRQSGTPNHHNLGIQFKKYWDLGVYHWGWS